MAKLEVQIGADSSELKSELAAAESKIERLSKLKVERVKLGLDTKTLDDEINRAKSSLNSLKQANTDLGKSFDKTSPKIASGSNTLMQFSRIAQDAPFGIIGIGNNLTATAESFGYLSKQAGGAGNALKAIGSSIIGTGGILLGVSLLTTGLTYLAQNGLTVSDVFNKMTGTFDENAKALNNIGVEAAKTSGSEIASLKALVSVAQDDVLSREKRLIAVRKLQSEYPAYFGNLSKEQILNGDVSLAIDDVSRALIARARASAIASKLGELASKRLELEEKREKAILDIKEAQKKSDADSSIYAAGLRFNLKAAVDSYKSIVKEIKELDVQSKKYSERENTDVKNSISLLKEKEKVLSGSTKKKAPNITPQVSGVDSGLQSNGLIDLNTIATFTGQVDQFGNKIKSLPGVITTSMGQVRTIFSSETLAMLETMQAFNTEMNNILNNGAINIVGDFGASIGQALASGGNVLKAAGGSLLSGLGSILVDLGKLAIKTGVGILAVKNSLKTLNPGIAIAAGVALVAIGSAFKSQASSIGSSMGGGGSSGSSRGNYSTGADYSSPSYSGGSSSVASGGTVVFEIDGQKLVGVLSNTLNKNTRLGGKLSIG